MNNTSTHPYNDLSGNGYCFDCGLSPHHDDAKEMHTPESTATWQVRVTNQQIRATRFVDWFITSTYFDMHTERVSDDWINAPERAQRCYDAASTGGDGSTHYERIQDMRNAFSDWYSDRRSSKQPMLFAAAVAAHFNNLELWHERNGSLHNQIG